MFFVKYRLLAHPTWLILFSDKPQFKSEIPGSAKFSIYIFHTFLLELMSNNASISIYSETIHTKAT